MFLALNVDPGTSTPDLGAILLSIGGGAVGAALIGVAGALIANAAQGSIEHRRWLREKRYECYLNLLKATDTVMRTIHVLSSGNVHAQNRSSLRDELLLSGSKLQDSAAEVAVLGNPEASMRGILLIEAIVDLPSPPTPDQSAVVGTAREAFVDAVRRDIGIPNSESVLRFFKRRALERRLKGLSKRLEDMTSPVDAPEDPTQ
jgi:hypothetical protein